MAGLPEADLDPTLVTVDPVSVLDEEIAEVRRERMLLRAGAVGLVLLALLATWLFWPRGSGPSRHANGPLPTCALAEAKDGGPLGSGVRGLVPGLPFRLADLDGLSYHVTYRHEPGIRPGTLLVVTRCTPDNSYALTVAR